MLLKELWVSNYKNLNNFLIKFQNQTYYELLIGKNGSGKSNLFELIIEIFQYLFEGEVLSYDFKVQYTIDNKNINIEFEQNKLKLNETEVEKIDRKYLPEHILIYYSGHNDRVEKLIIKYEQKYRNKVKGNEPSEFRMFSGIGKEHKNVLLLVILFFEEEFQSTQNIKKLLEISKIGAEIKFVFKSPFFFNKNKLDAWDQNKFWGTKGYLIDFLLELERRSSNSSIPRKEGFIFEEQKYYLFIKKEDFHDLIKDFTPKELFQYLDDLRVIGILENLGFDLELDNGVKLNSSQFSDGQIQTILFNGVIEIFKEDNTITLLDEPDSFLHPEWQMKLISQLNKISDKASQTNHILIGTHCASTIVSTEEDNLTLFQVNQENIKNRQVNLRYAVEQLSSGILAYNSHNSILEIFKKVKNNNKPIFFTEGRSDQIIIEKAWEKLKSDPMPFNIISAFNRDHLRQLLQDEKIFNEAGGKPIFELFDFDEAYNDWKHITDSEQIIETDPHKCLSAKLKNKKGYAILLPVPHNDKIKSQVIKDEDNFETYKHESKLSIELLFYGIERINDYYIEEPNPGGGTKISFYNDKKK